MKYAARFGCPLVASLSLLLLCPPLNAQLPRGLEECLPYPTLAQELKDMRDETQNPATETNEARAARARIVSIALVGGSNLSPSLREILMRQVRSDRQYDDPQLDWLIEIQEVDVRGFLQDTGYFRAEAALEAHRIAGEGRPHDYSLILNVEPGPQYRLGAVRFESGAPDKTLSFPQDELRRLLALNRGDVFRASKIRTAMESITRFYGSNGFIDCVPMPVTSIDENAKTIDLSFRIDEGRQYRVGKVEIVGMSEESKSKLKSAPQPGQVFDRSHVQEFLLRNKASLPPGVDERSVEVSRDARAGIVNLKFDFWSYPSCAGLTIAQMPAPPRR
jgi:surface antigen-like variable number repeat protein